jgi:hypothetical protein
VLLVVFVVVGLFPGVVLRGEALCERDLTTLHWPLRTVYLRLVGDGGWPPAWNPLEDNGQPFAANPQHAALHLLTWLFHLLPFAAAFNLQLLLPLIGTAAAMLLLLRTLGLGRAASLYGATTWGFGGWALSLANLPPLLLTAAPLPAVLAFALRTRRGGRTPDAVGLAACLALACAGGEPLSLAGVAIALAVAACAPRALLMSGAGDQAPPRRSIVALAAAVALGLLIAAAVLLPAARLVARSARATPPPAAESAEWSLPPERLAELFVPPDAASAGQGGMSLYWTRVLYPGRTVPLLYSLYLGLLLPPLVVAGLRRTPPAWLALAGGGLVLALGDHVPLLPSLVRAVPVVGTARYPEKWLLLVVLGAVVAAAHGFERIADGEDPVRRRVARYLVAFTVFAALLGGGVLLVSTAAPAAWRTVADAARLAPVFPRALATIAAAQVALALLAVIVLRWRRIGAAAPALLLAVTALDLVFAGRPLVPSCAASAMARVPAFLAPLLAEPAPGRLYHLAARQRFADPGAFGMLARPPIPHQWGLATAFDEDLDNTQLAWSRRATELLWRAIDRQPALLEPLLARRGVGAVLHLASGEPARIRLDRVDDPAPDAFCAARVARFAGDDGWVATALALGPELRHAALVEGDGAVGMPERPSPCVVTVLDERPDRLGLDVSAAGPAPSLLLVNRTWDDGWRAAVDGAPVRPLRTDLSLLALALPPGTHRVALRYRDPALALGLPVSLAALLLALAALVASTLRRTAR